MDGWEQPLRSLRRRTAGVALMTLLAAGLAAAALRAGPGEEAGSLRVLPSDAPVSDAGDDGWTPVRPGSWRALPPAPIAARLDHASVWTGREIIVWGGFDQFSRPLTDGARFDPVSGRWALLPATRAQRPASAAVWTGAEVALTASDATWRFDPVAEVWRSAPPVPVPDDHILDDRVIAVGSGIVAITEPLTPDASPAVFLLAPDGDRWQSLPDLPITLTRGHVALGNGTRILVFGPPAVPGQPAAVALETEGRGSAWLPFPAPPGLDRIELRTLVGGVGGDTIALWGARSGGGGGWTAVYDGRRWRAGRAGPLRATWSTVGHWTGRRLLVWDRSASRGAIYDPTGDRWSPLPEPELRGTGVRPATWTGTSLVVWGSFGSSGAIIRPR